MSRALALFALLCLAACDSGSEPPPPTPPPPAEDEVVAGVNLTELFASPTAAERDSVRAVWDVREAERTNRYAYGEVARGEGDAGETLIVVSGRLAEEPGEPVVHHLLIRVPPRAPGDARPLPVLFVSPQEREASPEAFFTSSVTPTLRDEVPQVLVGWRGGAVVALGQRFGSALPASPYDADADDALAAQAALPGVDGIPFTLDFGRSAWAGRGRGGTVALLASARSSQPDAAVSWAAPTSFFLPTVLADTRRMLRGGDPSALPGFDGVYREAVFPIRGDSAALAAARREFLLRSPLYFSDLLPPTFLIHSPADAVVPAEHAAALDGRLPDPEPLGFARYAFPEQSERPDHASTFSYEDGLRTAERFLAYHLGL